MDGEVGLDDDAIALSPETLAALREFALGKGVVFGGGAAAGDGEDGEDGGGQTAIGSDVVGLVRAVQQHFDVKEKEQIFKIAHGDVRFEVLGLKRELGQTLDSTGLTIWRAADRLCEYMVAHQEAFRGRRVLELGCGLGVVAILLAKLQLDNPQIVATDGDDKSMQLLQRNMHATGCADGNLVPAELLWSTNPEELAPFLARFEPFDLVLAADVIYDDAQVAPLCSTAAALLLRSPEARFYLAFARRNVPVGDFLSAAEAAGLAWEVVLETGEGEAIYCLRWAAL